MSRAESMSLRARINRFARREGISPQLALQGFFIERFLARIEKSEYAGNLVVKGGTLMCAILGLRQRTTMDIDTTLVGLRGDEETVERVVEAVAAVDAGDGVVFRRTPVRAESIAKDDEYGGWSIGLTAELGSIKLPIGIDVTYGDAMTPGAVPREFSGVLDRDLRIRLLAYPPETLMAEKAQSILKRGVATTRPRDFYDLHMLCLRGEYDIALFEKALEATVSNRHSEEYLSKWSETLDAIAKSDFQKRQWERYRKKMSFARKIEFSDLVASVVKLLEGAVRGGGVKGKVDGEK